METKHVLLLASRCTRFELHSFVRRTNTSFGWSAERAQRGGFVFPLLPVCFCRAVQAGVCPSSTVCPFRPVCSPVVCFSLCLERDCEFEGEHISRRTRQYQVVIWNPSLAWETHSRRVNRVCSETNTMHVSWLKIQEIRRFVFAESRVGKTHCWFFCLCTHIHPRACCCVTWLYGSILLRYLLSWYLDECKIG